MRLLKRLAAAIAVVVTLFSGTGVDAQRGAPRRLPGANSPTNDPEGASAVAKVAKDFKGTRDLAGAAEALVEAAGPKFKYDYGFDVQSPLYRGLTGVTSLNDLFAQRLLICYEFVHYVAYLAGTQRVTASGAPRIVGSDDTVWDPTKFVPYNGGDIPRGKVIIFKGIAFNNGAGFYHVGVSLGHGLVAHNSSAGNVQISRFADVDSVGYKRVYIGDYPWAKNGDPPQTNPPPTTPAAEATTTAENKAVNGAPPATPQSDPPSATGATPAGAPPAPNNPTAPDDPAGTRPSTGLRDALDAAPGGMRLADNASCCGDPLGKRVPASTAAPRPQYQLLITAGGIDRSINYSADEQDKNYALRLPRIVIDAAAATTAWLWRGTVVHAATSQTSPEAVSVSLIATGRSSGDALRVAIISPSGYQGRLLASDAMMVEATSSSASVPQEESRPGIDVSALQAFCAQFVKLPPAAGTVYRVASDAVQAKYLPLRKLLRAADTLKEAGRLHPDSEAGGYLSFIKQYALWTKLEGWDAKGFESHVLEKGREAATATGRSWTRDLEAAVRKSVPGRWADVQAVIASAR